MIVSPTPLARIPLARILSVGLCLGASLIATPAIAQTPAPAQNEQPAQNQLAPNPTTTSAHAVDPVKARYNVQVMEAVLERSVRYAAGQMNRRLQAVSPDLLQLSGNARARGFRLPGYGVFFDVDVPAALRHTMGWTLRLMQQSDQNVQRALAEIKQSLGQMDPKQRGQTEFALKILESRFAPPPKPRPFAPFQQEPTQQQPGDATAETVTAASAAGAPSATVGAPMAPPASNSGPGAGVTAVNSGTPLLPVPSAPSPIDTAPAPSANDAPATESATPNADDLAWAQNPDLAYEMEVREALVSAMLEHGISLGLGPDEYLTVAARDSENVVMPGDLSETVTVLMRIKGSDLYDYKAGRLSEADARRRIEVREF
jgi:hypothetical protein